MKKVLSIGQCDADNQRIGKMLNSNFSIEFATANDRRDAIPKLKNQNFDLVIVDRILDSNGDEGMDIIRDLKSDGNFKKTPVMLVSNFKDAQESAVSIGAEPGFGKATLDEETTLNMLKRYLEN